MSTYKVEMVVVVVLQADSEEEARIMAGQHAAEEIEVGGIITDVEEVQA